MSTEQNQIPKQEMSSEEKIKQKGLQLSIHLSQQFKSPLRDIMGQAEEVIQNTISTLIRETVTLDQEVIRLRKLCDDNKIKWNPQQIQTKEVITPEPTTAK